MDTLAVTLTLPQPIGELLPRLRRSVVATPDGGHLVKWYGSLRLSRATVYAIGGDRGTPVPAHRLVLEFSPGKVLRAHNVFASELCAHEALAWVLDEIEGLAGMCLHWAEWRVCRLDVAYTFLGLEARPYLAELARCRLPRRERVVYEDGVRFASKSRAEVFYDKRAEVAHAKRAEERRQQRVETVDGPLALGAEDIGTLPGLVAPCDGLAQAEQLVAPGALRVECRIRGSASVAKALGLDDARFGAVVTDDNAYKLLAASCVPFDFVDTLPTPQLARALREAGWKGARLLRLLGYLTLSRALDSEAAVAEVLGLKSGRCSALRRAARQCGAGAAGASSLRPLVVTRDDLARVQELDEEEQERWRVRRTAWRNFWGLPADELGLLAA